MIGALLVKDEADRYLAATIRSMQPVCEKILVLDDGSTDDTVALAESMGCEVRRRVETGMWGNETPARAELWDWGAQEAGNGWLYISDADHELVGDRDHIRRLAESWEVNCWGFRLYDCWDSPQTHRVDGQWAAYQVARPWMFRPVSCGTPQWGSRGLHAGHAPCNYDYRLGLAPSGVWIRHLGWMSAVDREAKVARYTAAAEHLRPDELAHLHSVSDASYPRAHA